MLQRVWDSKETYLNLFRKEIISSSFVKCNAVSVRFTVVAESVGEQGSLDKLTCGQNEIGEAARDQDERVTGLLDNYNAIVSAFEFF